MGERNTVVPRRELYERIARLQSVLCEKNIEGALIIQKTDLFYFGATSQQGWLYVPAEGEPLLMIFKEFERAKTESPLDEVVSITGSKKIPSILSDYNYRFSATLGMELDVLPVNLYYQFQSIFGQAQITDISVDIRLIRAVKSKFEIEKIRAAAKLSDQLAEQVKERLAVGKTEVALAGELEGYARSLGHQGIVRMRMWGSELFYGHLLSGDAAAVPSYLASPTGGTGVSSAIGQGAGFREIAAQEPVLVDYVFALDGYLSDHARIFSIGPLPEELVAAHQAMLDIQEEIKGRAKTGVVTGELYDLMVSMAEKQGYGENFMGVGDRRIRFTGHGIGLELDEFPFIAKGQKLRLEAGMIIALEPKIILPGKGVVGIENTHLVTDDGLEPLTKFPDEITTLSQ
jgi:Xaa-Pro dipeptidase